LLRCLTGPPGIFHDVFTESDTASIEYGIGTQFNQFNQFDTASIEYGIGFNQINQFDTASIEYGIGTQFNQFDTASIEYGIGTQLSQLNTAPVEYGIGTFSADADGDLHAQRVQAQRDDVHGIQSQSADAESHAQHDDVHDIHSQGADAESDLHAQRDDVHDIQSQGADAESNSDIHAQRDDFHDIHAQGADAETSSDIHAQRDDVHDIHSQGADAESNSDIHAQPDDVHDIHSQGSDAESNSPNADADLTVDWFMHENRLRQLAIYSFKSHTVVKKMTRFFIDSLTNSFYDLAEDEVISDFICTIEDHINTESELATVFHLGMQTVQGLVSSHTVARFFDGDVPILRIADGGGAAPRSSSPQK
jgi:hypothetical protein